MTASRIATLILVLVTAAGLTGLGRWGRRNAFELVGPDLPEAEREKRALTVRRGGVACYAASVVMALVGLLALL